MSILNEKGMVGPKYRAHLYLAHKAPLVFESFSKYKFKSQDLKYDKRAIR